MGEWTVAGREFRTQKDYEAAKRDAAYIEKIKNRYKLENKEELQKLYRDLEAGKYRFLTILGQDFQDEIKELSEKREQTVSNQTKKKKGTKKEGTKKKETAKKRSGRNVRLEDFDPDMQKVIKAELKKRERNRRLVILACVSTAVICFGYLTFYYYQMEKNENAYNSLAQLKEKEPVGEVNSPQVQINYEDGTKEVPEILDEYKNLYNKNKKLIGWIRIDDNNKDEPLIDYPVMQTENNEYYLRRNFNQEYDKNGSIFLDKDCDVLNRSTNLIIYGHHMSSGKMFGKLDKYSSKDFYKDHKYIQFDTIYEKGTYEVMYVFRSRIYEEDEIVFKYYQFIDANSETEFNSYMDEMAAMSLYDTGVTARYGDELITLSTCDYYTSYGRFVVVAKKVK